MAFKARRLVTAARLAVTNPRGLANRMSNLSHSWRTRRALGRLEPSADGIRWKKYGDSWFPYSGDGDEQEISYHTNFDKWYQGTVDDFCTWLKPGSVAVDVGANLGLTTLAMARLAGPTGRVHSFEPSATAFEKLQRTMLRNQLEQVECHRLGCGRQEQQMTLWIPASSGNASLRPTSVIEGDATTKSEVVRLISLDGFLGDRLERLDLLKIDTEGFEIDALEGADGLVSRCRPVIFIELCREFAESSARSIEWLRDHNYGFPVEPDLSSVRNGTNFFAIPREKL